MEKRRRRKNGWKEFVRKKGKRENEMWKKRRKGRRENEKEGEGEEKERKKKKNKN